MAHIFSKRVLYQIGLLAGAVLFSAALQTSAAFTEPNTAPPNADSYAPLTTSPTTQIKQGDLILNGSAGIGVSDPESKLDINGDLKINNTMFFDDLHRVDGSQQRFGIYNWDGTTILANFSDKTYQDTRVRIDADGNVNASGNVNAQKQLCIAGDCKPAWPGAVNVGSIVNQCPNYGQTMCQNMRPLFTNCVGQFTDISTCVTYYTFSSCSGTYTCYYAGHLMP